MIVVFFPIRITLLRLRFLLRRCINSFLTINLSINRTKGSVAVNVKKNVLGKRSDGRMNAVNAMANRVNSRQVFVILVAISSMSVVRCCNYTTIRSQTQCDYKHLTATAYAPQLLFQFSAVQCQYSVEWWPQNYVEAISEPKQYHSRWSYKSPWHTICGNYEC